MQIALDGIESQSKLSALYSSTSISNLKAAELTVPAQSVHVFAVNK
jgi:hypothetical protein